MRACTAGKRQQRAGIKGVHYDERFRVGVMTNLRSPLPSRADGKQFRFEIALTAYLKILGESGGTCHSMLTEMACYESPSWHALSMGSTSAYHDLAHRYRENLD